MAPTATLDTAFLDRVAEAVQAEPALLAAILADPASVARERFGVELPAGFMVQIGPDGGRFGAPGDDYTFDLSPELRAAAFGDELPDELLEMSGGFAGKICGNGGGAQG